MINLMGVAWAWSTLSELLAYLDGSKLPLGQRGSDNRGWTVYQYVCHHDCWMVQMGGAGQGRIQDLSEGGS